MPIMDGLTAAENIAGSRLAPVVILTAFSQRDLVERAREAGAMAYLVKPFQKKDLVPTIEMAVSRFQEIVALEGEVADLTGRLEARKLIDRAKGVLQTEHGLTEPEAFRWIQRASKDQRRSMRPVAQDVVDGLAAPERTSDRALQEGSVPATRTLQGRQVLGLTRSGE
jgi:response regulator NasT